MWTARICESVDKGYTITFIEGTDLETVYKSALSTLKRRKNVNHICIYKGNIRIACDVISLGDYVISKSDNRISLIRVIGAYNHCVVRN